jgi:hypothetical protein
LTPFGAVSEAKAARLAELLTIAGTERTGTSPPPDLIEQAQEVAVEVLHMFAAGDVPRARSAWKMLGTLLRYGERRPGAPRMVSHEGRTQNERAWARQLGLSTSALSYRLKTMPEGVALLSPQMRARVARVWEILRLGQLLLALAAAEGNQRKAADALGMSAQRVSQLVNEYGMRGWVDGLRAAA